MNGKVKYNKAYRKARKAPFHRRRQNNMWRKWGKKLYAWALLRVAAK